MVEGQSLGHRCILTYEERGMRQKLKDEDCRRKQLVAEKRGSQTRPKWAKMDSFGPKARPNLTAYSRTIEGQAPASVCRNIGTPSARTKLKS